MNIFMALATDEPLKELIKLQRMRITAPGPKLATLLVLFKPCMCEMKPQGFSLL